jgi:hypothetical protein
MGGFVNVDNIPMIQETLLKIAANGQRHHSTTAKRRAGPCTITEGGKLYTVATDGKMMLAVEETKEFLAKIAVPLALPDGIKATHTVSIDELRKFAGKATWGEPCPACQGTSAKSEHVSCALCDDCGVSGGDVHRGFLFDMPVDLRLVACAIESAESVLTVTVMIRVIANSPCFWIIGSNWRAVIMGHDVATTAADPDWKDAPRFPPVPVVDSMESTT